MATPRPVWSVDSPDVRLRQRIVMRRILLAVSLLAATAGLAQSTARQRTDAQLTKKETSGPDESLAGEVKREAAPTEAGPSFTYDQYRTDLEIQVAEKRREQIRDLQKIIDLNNDQREQPKLLFQLGELYWEESRYYFFEANRKDDDKIAAIKANDKAGVQKALAEKERLGATQRNYASQAVQQYLRIVQNYPKYEKTDQVLYYLGVSLSEMGDERRSVAAFQRLIDTFKASEYLPDAFLALGESHFNNSNGNRKELLIALANYQSAAKYIDNPVYAYAVYKQGWCYFNLVDYVKAMDQFKAVVLYAQFQGVEEVEGPKTKKGNRTGLAREARNDYVRAYSRGDGGPANAKEAFSKLTQNPDDLRTMRKQLADLYYADGKDREAVALYQNLIKEQPLHIDAAGFQARIVDCVMRAGKKDATIAQVQLFAKVYDDVAKANPKPDKAGQKSLDDAKKFGENMLSRLAVDWHNEGKKTRDDRTFTFADAIYDQYLKLYPEGPKSYELRFFYASLLFDNLAEYERAAVQYDLVVKTDAALVDAGKKPGKRLNEAAYASVLAWTEVVKKAQIKAPVSTDPTKKLPLPREKAALVAASERYIKYVPKGEKRIDIMYRVAHIYYDYNYFDEAVNYYSEIALRHPDYKDEGGNDLGEISAQTIIDTYNLTKDWQKLNSWARRFYNQPKLGSASFKEEMKGYIEQSSFKLISELELKKDYKAAGDAYVTFVTEWPKSKLADTAYYNAAVDYFRAGATSKAIDVRKQLVSRYPRSPHVPATTYALAEGYEAVTDFDSAADYFESYASNYERSQSGSSKLAKAKKPTKKSAKEPPKPEAAEKAQVWEESKAKDGLLNATIYRAGLGQTKQSLADREKFLFLWPNSAEADTVERSMIDEQEKLGSYSRVTKALTEYKRRYEKEPNKVLYAEGRLAALYTDKLKDGRSAASTYKRINEYYDKLGKRARESLDKPARDAAARASYEGNADAFRFYSNLKLRWSNAANPGELKTSIARKGEGLAEVKKLYTKTIAFKSAGPAICSLEKIGDAYSDLANELVHFPVPRGISDETINELRPQFEEQAIPVKKQAEEFYVAAVDQSKETSTFNTCATTALQKLRAVDAGNRFPEFYEDIVAIPQDKLNPTLTVTNDLILNLPDKAPDAAPATGAGVGANASVQGAP